MATFQTYTQVGSLSCYAAEVTCMEFSPCGRYLLTGGDDGSVIFWDYMKGLHLHDFVLDATVLTLCWGSSSSFFVGCRDGTLYFYENVTIRSIGLRSEVLIGVDAPIFSVYYDKVSDRLAVAAGSEVQIAARLNRRTYATLKIMPGPEETPQLPVRPRSVRLKSNGSQLVAAYLNHGVICWDVETLTNMWSMDFGLHDTLRPVGGVHLSRLSDQLLLPNGSGGMYLCVLGLGNPVQEYSSPRTSEKISSPTAIFLNRDRHVTCGSNSGNLYIWNASDGKILQVLDHEGHCVQSTCSMQRHSGSVLASATSAPGKGTAVRIWTSTSDKIGLFDSIWSTWEPNFYTTLDYVTLLLKLASACVWVGLVALFMASFIKSLTSHIISFVDNANSTISKLTALQDSTIMAVGRSWDFAWGTWCSSWDAVVRIFWEVVRKVVLFAFSGLLEE